MRRLCAWGVAGGTEQFSPVRKHWGGEQRNSSPGQRQHRVLDVRGEGKPSHVNKVGRMNTYENLGRGRAPSLALQIIPLASLHHVILLFGREMKLMIAQSGTRVGRVAQAVLAAQFLFDLPVDLVDRLFLGDFKQASPGLAGDLRQDFLAVPPFLREPLRITSAAPAIRPASVRAAAITSARPSQVSVAVCLLIRKKDRVNNRIGPLRCLDGVLQGLLASAIHSVREDHERLPALLFLDHFVRRQKDRIVERRAASNSPRISAATATRVSTASTRVSATPGVSAATAASAAGAGIGWLLRDLQQLERRLQLLVRRGQVLQE